MFKILVSEHARRDMNAIIAYISTDLDNPEAASAFACDVLDLYDRLEQNPMLYEFCRDAHLKQTGYRRATIKSYVVIYVPDEEAKIVKVHRIFHSSQNYTELI